MCIVTDRSIVIQNVLHLHNVRETVCRDVLRSSNNVNDNKHCQLNLALSSSDHLNDSSFNKVIVDMNCPDKTLEFLTILLVFEPLLVQIDSQSNLTVLNSVLLPNVSDTQASLIAHRLKHSGLNIKAGNVIFPLSCMKI